jgi:hypothetical protein
MDYLFSVALMVHIVAAIGVIGLVLVQHGKGADMGAALAAALRAAFLAPPVRPISSAAPPRYWRRYFL